MAASTRILPPRISDPRLEGLADGDPSDLDAHASFERLRFADADLTDADLVDIGFEECALERIRLHEADLTAASLVDVLASRLDAPVLKAPRIRMRDVRLEGSRVGSAELYDASLSSVHITDCQLGFVNLRGSKITDLLITDCAIEELDLRGTAGMRVAFARTTIGTLDLADSSLTHLDLRGAEIMDLDTPTASAAPCSTRPSSWRSGRSSRGSSACASRTEDRPARRISRAMPPDATCPATRAATAGRGRRSRRWRARPGSGRG
ncbi:Pentapeptide repeats (8 copies) [Clavibacter michiganensis subsp. michiganensis]|nr:pentapeptide repeat-containing protein [Clavibacter michiganensis]OUE14991.1 Pentapeptide repeats (8 copies) [Clavibacter michiganensis subsp. michiganensis]